VKIDPDDFRVRPGEKVRLEKWPTSVKPYYASDAQYRERLAGQVERLADLQSLLYATDRHALLLVFQAMDAAGKDGVIKHVMSGVNPQGCQVFSFKHPSAEELDHDFLWRTTRFLPERGRIGIFNRSYYEEVLIVRVHPEILRAQKLPEDLVDGHSIWKERFASISALEAHLSRNGTRILKFFLHLSKEEQRLRFLSRIDEPHKNWKFSLADVEDWRLEGEEAFGPTERAELARVRTMTSVDYPVVRRLKMLALAAAYRRFRETGWNRGSGRRRHLQAYCEAQAWWLDDYALFRALHARHSELPWTCWPDELRARDAKALGRAREALAEDILFVQYLQWTLDTQWRRARELVGDAEAAVAGIGPVAEPLVALAQFVLRRRS